MVFDGCHEALQLTRHRKILGLLPSLLDAKQNYGIIQELLPQIRFHLSDAVLPAYPDGIAIR